MSMFGIQKHYKNVLVVALKRSRSVFTVLTESLQTLRFKTDRFLQTQGLVIEVCCDFIKNKRLKDPIYSYN